MKRSVKSIALGALLLAGAGLTASPATAGEQWSMATPWPGGPLLEVEAKGIGEQITFLTNKEIAVQVYPGGTLGSPLKVTETVRSGVAQMGHNWAGYDWGIDRTGVLFGGFAGSPGVEEGLHWFLKGGGLELMKQWRKEKFGVDATFCGMAPREIFLHSRKPVKTLADYKGMKVRTSGAWAEIAPKLGATTVILPGAEVYPALERGVVDGIEWGTPSMNKAAGYAKIAKYIVVPGMHQPAAYHECEFNPEVWKKVSDRDKELIELAGRDRALNFWLTLGNDDAVAFAEYEHGDNEIDVLDSEFQKAALDASAEWAEEQAKDNAWFKKVWDSQKAYHKQWMTYGPFR
jgi:TRAP-type mannitol/chloroaromatic compound transport system substrate-binding protein